MAVPISTSRVAREVPLGLARALICAQGVARSSVEATARALALLLRLSGEGPLPRPVVLSGDEGAARCGFERRTWWIVKRRLLALGHLVASAGGQAPSGSHGGRGRKGTYCVSPATFARFLEGEEAWIAGLPIEDIEEHLVGKGLAVMGLAAASGVPSRDLRWREKVRLLGGPRSPGSGRSRESRAGGPSRSGSGRPSGSGPPSAGTGRARKTVMHDAETGMRTQAGNTRMPAGPRGARLAPDGSGRRSPETVMQTAQTGMRSPETVMQTAQTGMPTADKTVMRGGETGMRSSVSRTNESSSQHRRSSCLSVDPSKTSDVLKILEGRTDDPRSLEHPGTLESDDQGLHHSFPETSPERPHHSFPETSPERPHHGFREAPRDDSHHSFATSGAASTAAQDSSAGKTPVSTDAVPAAGAPLPGAGLPGADALSWLGARVLESRGQPHGSGARPGTQAPAVAGQPLESLSLQGRALGDRSSRSQPFGARSSRSQPFGGRHADADSLRPREIVQLFEREPRARVREALVRLLDRALLLERFDACLDRRERLALLRALPRQRPAHASLVPDPQALPDAPLPTASPARTPDAVHDARAPGPLSPGALAGSRVSGHGGKGIATRDESGARGAPAVESRGAPCTVPPSAATSSDVASGPAPASGARAERRRARAPHPLWAFGDEAEKREVWDEVAAILERANREFKASFDVERSRRDTLLYPYEVVRRAVANVLLKEARGYRFENPGAVLWDGITLPGYRLEEFAVANLEEVRKRCVGTWAPAAAPPPERAPAEAPAAGESERQRAEARRALLATLPGPVREDLDRRAGEVGRTGFIGRGSAFDEQVLALRVHRARDEILEREHGDALAVLLASGSGEVRA